MPTKTKTKWRRYRFQANLEDYRPVVFPTPGPYWCSGSGDEYSIVITYLPTKTNLKKYWPEASDIEFTDEDEIHYTDRFPKPEWWKGE